MQHKTTYTYSNGNSYDVEIVGELDISLLDSEFYSILAQYIMALQNNK